MMKKVVNIFKNMLLDLYSMGKGFLYGFIMVGLLVVIVGALLYGVLYLKNVLF
jgi:hypothetical protein